MSEPDGFTFVQKRRQAYIKLLDMETFQRMRVYGEIYRSINLNRVPIYCVIT